MRSEPPSPDADDFHLHAWVDESMWLPRDRSSGTYFLAAAVADPNTCEPIRDSMRSLLPRRADRLHWRHETPQRQIKIAEAIAVEDLVHVVVIGVPLDPRRQERGRRHCMERLLHALSSMGVSRAWFESRHPALNRRDVKMVDALRSKNAIKGITVEFALPKEEQMLWIADAVAGAVSGAERGTREAREALGSTVDEVRIELA